MVGKSSFDFRWFTKKRLHFFEIILFAECLSKEILQKKIALDVFGKLGRAVSFGSVGTVKPWSVNREPFSSFAKGHPTQAVYHV